MKIWPIYEITLQFDEMLAPSKLLENVIPSELRDCGLTEDEISKIHDISKQIEPFVPKTKE